MKRILIFFLTLSSLSCWSGIPKVITGTGAVDELYKQIIFKKAEVATVVVFLSATCPCSDSHIPYLKKLKTEFPKMSFIAIHSNMDEDEKTTATYFKSAALPFDVIQDDNAKLADEFRAFKTPHAFIVSKDGNVLYEGGVTSSAKAHEASHFHLRDAITDLVNGREIKTKEVRTLGCAIAREKD